jgi:hypothetical protein
VKDAAEDVPRLTTYFELVVRERAKRRGGLWGEMLEAGRLLSEAPAKVEP